MRASVALHIEEYSRELSVHSTAQTHVLVANVHTISDNCNDPYASWSTILFDRLHVRPRPSGSTFSVLILLFSITAENLHELKVLSNFGMLIYGTAACKVTQH